MRFRLLYFVLFPAMFQAAAARPPIPDRPTAHTVVKQYPLGAPEVPPGLASAPASATTADGATWTAQPHGLSRLAPTEPRPEDRARFYQSRRYLPDNDVQRILAEGSGVGVQTRTGVSHLTLQPMTLEQKAAAFEARIRARHDRYGMVADSRLTRPGDLTSNQLFSNDNDGLWTAIYAAAKLHEFAVTRRPAALDAAKKSIEAVLFLEQVTGVPGFPARSYIRKDDPQPANGEWHPTSDGTLIWKGDTSSDEIVGHFFLFGLAWDLLPPSENALRERVAATARRIMDYIIGHGYTLVDLDGKPTRWGWWNWEYFRGPDKADGPLNALEVLSFLKTTHHITQNGKYAREYRRIALDEGYLAHTAKYLEMREEINYSDEELAMLPFYLIFRYEKDPAMLKIYRLALDQWWVNCERERNPLWHFIYQTANPRKKVDLPLAVHTLQRIPLDLVKWTYDLTSRPGLQPDPALDRFNKPQTTTWLPPDERPVMKWNGNPFSLHGGNGGRGEDDGAFFLLPYWLGRYHRFIGGPASH
jgi:hypothetical protein